MVNRLDVSFYSSHIFPFNRPFSPSQSDFHLHFLSYYLSLTAKCINKHEKDWNNCFFLLLFTIASYSQEDILYSKKDSLKVSPDSIPIQKTVTQLQEITDNLLFSPLDCPSNTKYNYLNKLSSNWKKQKKTILNSSYSAFILPTALISYGIISHIDGTEDIETQGRVKSRQYQRVYYDDYLQFAPIAAAYGLNFAGLRAKHSLRERTFIGTASYLLMASSVYLTKKQTHVLRPDKSDYLSFPSGHTATAFVGAHILFREYHQTSPWISVIGYATAATTGVLRIRNNKHWVSDVITGAGVGMLSVELSYLMLPLFNKITGVHKNEKKIALAPLLGKKLYGIGLAYAF